MTEETTLDTTPAYTRKTGRLAPRKFLLAVMLGTAVLTVAAVYLAQARPWLGLKFSIPEQGAGLIVSGVQSNSQNAGRVSVGTRILGLASANGDEVSLNHHLLLEDPDILPYIELNNFMEQQDHIIQILQHQPVAITATGQRISLAVGEEPWTSLTPDFILHTLYALIALIISMSIWVVRPQEPAARYFAISGIAVVLNELPLAVYTSRDLVLSGDLFRLLSSINHAGTMLLCASLTALFWNYPRRLTRFPVPVLLFAFAFTCWLLDFLQVGDGASTTIYLPILISYLLGLIFARAQWKISKNRPTDRAALKWCLLAIFSGTVLLIGLVTIPPVFSLPPLVPLAAGYVGFLMIYLGLAAGLLRYRLFDIERWWFRTWLWFVSGLLVVAMDMTLVYVMNLSNTYALTASLAIAGWLYFPMRQWLWTRLGRQLVANHEGALRLLVQQLLAARTKAEILEAWPHLLQRSFAPLRLYAATTPVGKVSVAASGGSMTIPPLSAGQTGQVMEFPLDGGRLFTPEDARMADLLYDLTCNALDGLGAREAGADAERERIMRDLHDDLGARLLSLVYAADNERAKYLARAAMDDLYAVLETARGMPRTLRTVVSTWQQECSQRLQEAGISHEIRLAEQLINLPNQYQLSPRLQVNTARILREATSNIIRHSKPNKVTGYFDYSAKQLTITLSDYSKTEKNHEWKKGNGLRTMQTRANEIGAQLEWVTSPHGCEFKLTLPLPANLVEFNTEAEPA